MTSTPVDRLQLLRRLAAQDIPDLEALLKRK